MSTRLDACRMIRSIMDGAISVRAIAERHGMDRHSASLWIKDLKSAGVIHISEWDYVGDSTTPTPFFSMGNNADAVKPLSRSEFLGYKPKKRVRARRKRVATATTESINATLQAFAAIQKDQS